MAYVADKYVEQVIADFDDIEAAIVENGVDVPYGTDTKEYGRLVRQACTNQQYKAWYEDNFVGTSVSGQFSEVSSMLPFDFSKVTDFSEAFIDNQVITTIPKLDTRNGITFSYMFSGCGLLEEVVSMDISNGTDVTGMFSYCPLLKTVPKFTFSPLADAMSMFEESPSLEKVSFNNLPQNALTMFLNCNGLKTADLGNTKNVEQFQRTFSGCTLLESISELDFSGLTCEPMSMFQYCNSLKNMTIKPYTLRYSLTVPSAKLTDVSIQSIIDGLADMTGQTAQKLTLHSAVVAKLTLEQLRQMTNKNWY